MCAARGASPSKSQILDSLWGGGVDGAVLGAQTLPLAGAVSPALNQHGAGLQRLFSFFFFFLSFILFKANGCAHTGRKVFCSIEILFSGNYVKNVFILWAGWEKKKKKKKKGLNPPRWLFL